MITKISEFITRFGEIVWGLPLIILIMAVGIYLTLRLNVLQIIHLPKALKYMIKNEEGGKGEVSSFAALCTALSATIGTGNIVGVATAIVLGGPGALFWMWIAAFFGMATKYAEGVLAIKYRHINEDGHVLGGPFYYIEKGMGVKFKWLGKLFAFFGACAGLLGIGTFTQVNGISSAVNNFFSSSNTINVAIFGKEYSIIIIITGIVITLCVGLVLIGGIKRISGFAQIIVPFMAIAYVLICIILLVNNANEIPRALGEIFEGAFGLDAVAGGALGSIMLSLQKGVARGIFSNESGLGSAPIASAAAQTNEPVRQGLVSMTGTFIDTIIICTMTGLCIVITGAWNIGLEGVAVTANAFQTGLPFAPWVASFLLMTCLAFFAFTTIIGWNYYSERCLEYLTGGNQKPLKVFRWLYILAVFLGPYMTVKAVWEVADIFNGLMAFPNLIALIVLSKVIINETKDYFKRIA
jgi:AGCS family alanine or glycine:cation symporter